MAAAAASDPASKMIYRNLGRSGLKVSVISLGGWVTYGGQVGDDIANECIKAAYDHGVNFFDCAEVYADGKSEISMGKAIKKYGFKRNDIVVSTKIYWGSAFGDRPVNNSGLSRKHLVEGTNAALERLQLDYVDLLYCHRPDRDTPIEETVRAMNYLIDTGKTFYWGTSEWSAAEIAIAHQIADRLGLVGPLMEQPQYNLLARDKVEKEFHMLYSQYGLGLTIFSPLKTGILTGKYNSEIPDDSRYATAKDPFSARQAQNYKDKDPNWLKWIEQTKSLEPVAKKLNTELATLALAWVISNPNVSSAITGASKVEQVHKSMDALELMPKITDEIKKEIDEILGNKPDIGPNRF
ncbi:Putative Voltage-gated potassium channel subunit beta [[Torrubiella] hemipterigena]|uniref:Putative Voltage-gated potassium channel subunit beta n=1 Tax=[Torrubiella] hemipterigena TaxID=1531966 RepID=A0A0A1T4N0_9HYPO|nr:Putative Voltage-gated potassium channel subunit beta [[Torrubiella] hemipterigena]